MWGVFDGVDHIPPACVCAVRAVQCLGHRALETQSATMIFSAGIHLCFLGFFLMHIWHKIQINFRIRPNSNWPLCTASDVLMCSLTTCNLYQNKLLVDAENVDHLLRFNSNSESCTLAATIILFVWFNYIPTNCTKETTITICCKAFSCFYHFSLLTRTKTSQVGFLGSQYVVCVIILEIILIVIVIMHLLYYYI